VPATDAPAMRILYVLGGYGGEHLGGEIHAEMARAIRGRGHDYHTFAAAHRRDMASRTADTVEEGVPVHRAVCAGRVSLDLLNACARPILRAPWLAAVSLALGRFLRSVPAFDVIIAEGAYPLGTATAWAARRRRTPFIISVLGGDFLANEEARYGYARYAVPRVLMRTAFRRAAVVRAISPYAGAGAWRLGCPADKLALVPRNVAAGAFLPAGADRADFRRDARRKAATRFGLSEARLLVAVGRLLPIKGFDVLVRALPRIGEAADARLLLVGPNRDDPKVGDYRRHLESLARELGVGDRVIFVGAVPLEDVRDLLAAADAVIVPSLEEGGNKTMVEGAAVGTPFVATRTAGNADWARDWDAGVVVEPGSPDALARGILTVLEDSRLAEAMGANGVRFAAHFRTDRVAERMLALCRCAVAGSPLTAELREPAELRSAPAAAEVLP
jgi:glycosyltransferase involved in cell wall biosynthesis